MSGTAPEMRRILWLAAWAVAAAVVVVAVLFVWTWRTNPPARVVAVAAAPSGEVHIGEPVVYRVTVDCPWYRWPLRAPQVTVPDGLQELDARRPRLVGLRPGRWRWEFAARVQAYDLGEPEGAAMTCLFTADRRGQGDSLVVELPPVKVVPALAERTMHRVAVAPALEAGRVGRRPWWQWVALGGLVGAVLAVLISVWRRRTAPDHRPPPTPWEVAERELQAIEDALPLPADTFFVRLTDIVRGYIEARFSLPASEKTTPEFLGAMRSDRQLDSGQQAMLAALLEAADLVKFAKVDAPLVQMQKALAKAQDFVAQTRPRSVAETAGGPGGEAASQL